MLACIVLAQMGVAQSVDADEIRKEIAETGLTGNFTLDGYPIELNLPSGYIYLDRNLTEKILVGALGNPKSSMQDIIGMIVAGDISKLFAIEYSDVGHVRDDNAHEFDFDVVLYDYKRSNGINAEWAWTPEYDKGRHMWSVPFMEVSANEEELNHMMFKFGKTELVKIISVISPTDIGWLSKNNKTIADCVQFSPGHRYEDYNENTPGYIYDSLEQFLIGEPGSTASTSANAATSTTTLSGGPNYVVDESANMSLSQKVIRGIVKVTLVLVSVMLLLMLAVAISNKRKETSESLMRLGVKVLLRLGVFGVVYLLLLTFAVFLIWGGVWATIAILSNYISLKIIACVIGVWIFIGSFIFAILRSLVVSHRTEKLNRVEISESQAPRLFAIIKEVATASGEQMPLHVYVTPEVNACVFYNKRGLSPIFFGRKNLEIGLGLLFGLNEQELKAVIAHEYGHFGQKSMRVGQVVSVCYNVIYNLVNDDGSSFVRPILNKTFLYVQKGFLTLSRAMEYEADERGAAIAGNVAMISSLYKLEVISNRFEAYEALLGSIHESKKGHPESYWAGYELFEELSEDVDGVDVNASAIVTSALIKTPPSRVKLKDVWISHPRLEDRIRNISSRRNPMSTISTESIREIVNREVYDMTSKVVMQNAEWDSGTTFTEDEFRTIIAEEHAEQSFPLRLRPFFAREFSHFDIAKEIGIPSDKSTEEVFSDSNRITVEAYVQAMTDYHAMVLFKLGRTSEKKIQYEGKIYSQRSVPLETQYEILRQMEPEIEKIDKSVFRLALSKTSDKKLIVKAYNDIFYAQSAIRYIDDKILPMRDAVAKSIGKGGQQSEQAFENTKRRLKGFQDTMIELINKLEMSRLNPVMHIEAAENFRQVEYDFLFTGESIYSDEIQYIFFLPDQVKSLFGSLTYYSKKIISDTIEGKVPLMYWNNSVASQAVKV